MLVTSKGPDGVVGRRKAAAPEEGGSSGAGVGGVVALNDEGVAETDGEAEGRG